MISKKNQFQETKAILKIVFLKTILKIKLIKQRIMKLSIAMKFTFRKIGKKAYS
jgi:hypothetical protein